MNSQLYLNGEQARFHQEEMRRNASASQPQPDTAQRSPVLATVGRHLVNLGERLQYAAQTPEQPVVNLHAKQA